MTELMSHYTVLADHNLNKTFWHALQKCNLQRKTVLHLGKSPLLAIFALKAGAKHVYLCSNEKNIGLFMEKILSARERKKITLVNKTIKKCTLEDFKGKKVDIAIRDLEFTRKKVAEDIKKTVKSAIANAENNYQYDIDNLYVKEAYIGKSIVMKRFRPRAKGRASPIKKPFSRVTIILEEKKTELKKESKK